MRLLVSVRNASEAEVALAGGADIIDAKEPLDGPLGPVAPETLQAITARVGGTAPLSVALGDVGTDDIRSRMLAIARSRVSFVKIGFAGARRRRGLAEDVRAVANAIGSTALVLVAYADYEPALAPSPEEIVGLADDTRAAGLLIDTYDKNGAPLTTVMTARQLRDFVTLAKGRGRVVALAGRLTVEDVELVHGVGADILGVRGAACEGDRIGVISGRRVRILRTHIDRATEVVGPFA